MNPDWLGSYSDNGDSWEGGARSIRFRRTGDGQIRFDWRCRYESNHGYSEQSAWGRVIAAGDRTIIVELAETSGSSWEDMFKEHFDETQKTSRRVTIEVVQTRDGKPILRYEGSELWFVA